MVAEIKQPTENIPPEVVEINLPENSTTPEQKTKRKYKPREQKAETKSKKSASSITVGQAEINSLIVGVFSLVALKGGEHWAVSPDEAESISKPLSNVLEKMNMVEKVAEVSDGAMLLIATAMLIIPRVMITAELNKNKKVSKSEIVRKELEKKEDGKESRDIKKQSSNDNVGSKKEPTYDSNFNKSIFATNPQ